MIKIVLRNGNVVTWDEKSYTDYKYDGKFFIIIRDGQWVGFYNLDCVLSIEIDVDESEHEKSMEPGYAAVMTQEEVEGIFKALSK